MRYVMTDFISRLGIHRNREFPCFATPPGRNNAV
ncbi:hypothetical protein V1291_003005 [Nitrobacteraceae bacterium AZCC 1564]